MRRLIGTLSLLAAVLCFAGAAAFPLPRAGIAPQVTEWTWQGEHISQTTEFFDVPRVPWEVGSVEVEVSQRGYLEMRGHGAFFGLDCEPGQHFATKYQMEASWIGLAFSVLGNIVHYPASAPTHDPSLAAQGADGIALGQCHDNPTLWRAVVLGFPPSLFYRDRAHIRPDDAVQTFTLDAQEIRDAFEGSGSHPVQVASLFDWRLWWTGCASPYTIRRSHQVRVTVTLHPE